MTETGTGVRAAIIGTGMIAAVHHRAIRAAGGVLVGVLGSRPERSAEAAAEWDCAAYPDLEALLAADIDLVHVCTPNATHAEFTTAVLKSGRHVVCEKPVAVTVAQAEGLEALAAGAGLIAAVPFVYRYHPIVRELRERRIAGQFGPWHALHGSYLQDWMLAPDTGNWRVHPEAGGAHAPSPTSARTGATWWSSPPASAWRA